MKLKTKTYKIIKRINKNSNSINRSNEKIYEILRPFPKRNGAIKIINSEIISIEKMIKLLKNNIIDLKDKLKLIKNEFSLQELEKWS